MKINEAIKFQKQIKQEFGITVTLLDTAEGTVLLISKERETEESRKAIVEFANKQSLIVKEINGRFVVAEKDFVPQVA